MSETEVARTLALVIVGFDVSSIEKEKLNSMQIQRDVSIEVNKKK